MSSFLSCLQLDRATPSFYAFGLFLAFFIASPSFSADGVLEINQTCAVDTGCFAGDTAGLPVTINVAGSYQLTSNLDTAPSLTVDAIQITASGVTIDFKGFELAGPVICTGLGSAVSCSGGLGDGVAALGASRLTLRDGRVSGFDFGVRAGGRAQIRNLIVEANRSDGIGVGNRSIISNSTVHQNGLQGISTGNGATVQRTVASSNGSNGIAASSGCTLLSNAAYDNGTDGISTGAGAVVRGNSTYQNEAHGIDANSGSMVSENSAYDNNGDGIEASAGSSVRHNVARLNTAFGLDLAADVAYSDNTVNQNTGGTVNGGLNLGANSCNGAASCP